jgi:transcriptional regulator with XRE-family HTH domain
MNLNSRMSLIDRIRRGKQARRQFVESHLGKTLAHQIRATRDKLEWSQERLAAESGMNQNAISRLESPGYGKPTLTTLKRLAAAMDVGLIVRLVPFGELVDWVSGTPRTIEGLTTTALAVSSFDREEREQALGKPAVAPRVGLVAQLNQLPIRPILAKAVVERAPLAGTHLVQMPAMTNANENVPNLAVWGMGPVGGNGTPPSGQSIAAGL